jgi:hypothetical protein
MEAHARADITHTLAIAEHVLTTVVGRTVRLHLVEIVYDYAGAPSTVLRCGVDSLWSHAPRRVIVKRTNTPATPLYRKAAGLVFLQAPAPVRGLAPHFYGVDSTATVLVMEDVAAEAHHLLGNILFGTNVVHAEEALIAFNHAVGTMHSATLGQYTKYQQIRTRYGASPPSRHRIHQLLANLHDLPSCSNRPAS